VNVYSLSELLFNVYVFGEHILNALNQDFRPDVTD